MGGDPFTVSLMQNANTWTRKNAEDKKKHTNKAKEEEEVESFSEKIQKKYSRVQPIDGQKLSNLFNSRI